MDYLLLLHYQHLASVWLLRFGASCNKLACDIATVFPFLPGLTTVLPITQLTTRQRRLRAIATALASELRHHLTAAAVSLESVPAPYELSEHLAVPLETPLLVFDDSTYQGDLQSVGCGKTLSRSD